MPTEKKQILDLLAQFIALKGNHFVSLTYTNKHNEKAKYLVMVGARLRTSYEKDVQTLERYKTSSVDEELARQELLNSLRQSLTIGIGNNDAYTKRGYFTYLSPNIKYNEEGELYINSFLLSKTVIIPGQYNEVNSSAKTKAKNEIRRQLRMGKFREFKLDLSKINSVNINGHRFSIECA